MSDTTALVDVVGLYLDPPARADALEDPVDCRPARDREGHLDIHVALDNLSAHKAPEVAEWLAHPRRQRWHLHFTPTSSSWLNLVEGWFNLLTERRLRRGTFTSLDEPIAGIELWAEHWNDHPNPFVWTKTAQQILDKVKRGRATLNTVTKSATHH